MVFLFPVYFHVTFLKHALFRFFFVFHEHIATLAVIGELYACKCARMAYFGNGNFCTERGRILTFRTEISDGHGAKAKRGVIPRDRQLTKFFS